MNVILVADIRSCVVGQVFCSLVSIAFPVLERRVWWLCVAQEGMILRSCHVGPLEETGRMFLYLIADTKEWGWTLGGEVCSERIHRREKTCMDHKDWIGPGR